jgi:hypothetical protein
MPVQELLRLRRKELSNICKSYCHPISGNKSDLVSRIQQGTNLEARRPQTDFERLVRTWFMKPLARKHCLRLGSVRLQFELWKKTHALIAHIGESPLPPCKYIVPTGVVYWNKTKGFVDAMPQLMSHIKVPMKSGGPVLQLVFCFISIMVVNGYLMTCLLKLKNEGFETDESYNGVKKKMANETSLNHYVKVFAKHFELPDCIQR